jgi:DNA (cytosine-5)-methyltransferase 1
MNSGKDYKAREVDVAQPLMAGGPVGGNQGGDFIVQQPIAWSEELTASIDVAGTIQRGGAGGRHDGVAVPVVVPIAFNWNAQAAQLPSAERDTTINDGLTCSQQAAVAFRSATEFLPQSSRVYSDGEAAPTLQATGSRNGNRAPQIQTAMQVRRLTPTECERLQGFPDNHTAIPWRGKAADQCPDGPRYKALGNSWAVPVVAWIGKRIHNHLAATK